MTTENTTVETTETTETSTLSDSDKAKVDAMVAEARARKAAREAKKAADAGTEVDAPKPKKGAKKEKPAKVVKGKNAPKVEPTAEEVELAEANKAAVKAAKKAERDAERDAAKKIRDAARLAKKEARAAAAGDRKPAHLAKVEKAAAKLPVMTAAVVEAFDLVHAAGLTEGQTAILIAHLAHSNRVAATLRSHDIDLEVGQTVEIVSSDRDPRLIGKHAVITQVRKIRVLAQVEGYKKESYLFASDVSPITVATTDTEPTTVEPEADETPEFLVSEVSTGTEG
jgi:hypothetical protein